MISEAVRVAYLNQLTENGRKFFALVAKKYAPEFKNGLQFWSREQQSEYYFEFDPLTLQWLGRPSGIPPMSMMEFVSYHLSCDYDEAFWIIREQFFPKSIQSTAWTPAIELACHKASTPAIDPELQARIDRAGEILRRQLEESIEADKKRIEKLSTTKYQTSPAEVLHFYFRPGKKGESIFWTATMVVRFMNDQHPGFWKLSEEETGKLLNSEGFVICKGRQNGKRGYFINYREGFHPGIYIELQEAS